MKIKIQLNQVGYITNQTKTAVVISNALTFSVCSKKNDDVMYMGKLTPPIGDIASGDTVSTADFTELKIPGEFYLTVGAAKSSSFIISDYPYLDLTQALLKSYYFNRCGMSLREKYAGVYKRKKCHTEMASLYSNPSKKIDVTGGWHDAGDDARYTASAAVTLGHLLYSYEFFSEGFNCDVNIPESENGIPDILNECRYELNWLLKMQSKDGGVYQKVSGKKSSGMNMPFNDHAELFVYDKTSTSTADFSAVTALAARIFKKTDIDFSKKLESASVNAWAWLINNEKNVVFENQDRFLYADHGERNFYNDIFWAAAELYSLSGNESFSEKIDEIFDRVDTTSFTLHSVGGFGAISYIFNDIPKDPNVLDALKTAFIYKADNILSMSKHSGYGTAKQGNRYVWGSNMEILTYSMTLIIADKICPNKKYISAALEQINYILGKNPLGICYVTGFGKYSSCHPHHNVCISDGIEAPIKGLITGGPNMLRCDEYSRWLISKNTPPSKCYSDNEFSYSTNDTAIYFNSPAVFVLGFFNGNHE